MFEIWNPAGQIHVITVENGMAEGEWIHLAAVSGPGGMKLYLDGVLVGTNPESGSFSALGDAQDNFLGAHLNNQTNTTHGQIDEFRVWDHERTAEQVRNNLLVALSGTGEGLVRLWNFDNPGARVRDAVGRGQDLRLMNGARIVRAALPREVHLPAILAGHVFDASGRPVSGADIRLISGETVIAETISDFWIRRETLGLFRFAVRRPPEAYRLQAAMGLDGAMKMVELMPGQILQEELRLALNVNVTGSVTAMDDSPVSQATVELVHRPEADAESGSATDRGATVVRAMTDKEGRHQFGNIDPGTYQVRCVSAGGFSYPKEKPLVEIRHGDLIEGVDFRVSPAKKGRWKYYDYLDGLADDTVGGLIFDSTGAPWCATAGGVTRFDGRDSRSFTREDGLADNRVQCLYQDSQGVFWFGTRSGVTRYDGLTFKNMNAADGLLPGAVSHIAGSTDGRIWIATAQGLSILTGSEFSNHTRVNGLPADRVNGVAVATDGIAWLGTPQGLIRFDGSKFENVTEGSGLARLHAGSPEITAEGLIWFGSNRGAWRYDGRSFVNYSTRNGLIHDDVHHVSIGPDSSVWFATFSGISRFDGTRFVNF